MFCINTSPSFELVLEAGVILKGLGVVVAISPAVGTRLPLESISAPLVA